MMIQIWKDFRYVMKSLRDDDVKNAFEEKENPKWLTIWNKN